MKGSDGKLIGSTIKTAWEKYIETHFNDERAALNIKDKRQVQGPTCPLNS